jgi:molybdopterin-containing oxidoreductase family membrane subunit
MNGLLNNFLPRTGGLEPSTSKLINVAMAVFAIFTVIGIGFGVHSLLVGHEHTFGVSREVPWGALIAAYVFFVVTSTGLCIVSSIGHVFGIKNFEPIAKRAVYMSIITIIAGFIVIAFEIENTWRMPVGNVVGANLSSNIWWMGTLYGAYLVFMIGEFILLQKENHKHAAYFGLAGLLSGIAAHSNLGAVFGLLNGREFWHGPYMPIYFIASAALSGCVTIIFCTYVAHRVNAWQMSYEQEKAMQSVGKVAALTIAILIFFTIWKMIAGIAGHPPGKFIAMEALLQGPYAINFWIGEIAFGMIIPFIIILAVRAQNMRALFIASVCTILGIFAMRYDLVIVGQVIPHYHGMGLVDYPELFSYRPTLHELMVCASGLTFCGFFLLLGEKLFRGHLSESH